MKTKIIAFAVIAVALLIQPKHTRAAVVAEFNDGNTGALPDGFAGSAGDGWAGAWTQNSATGSVSTANSLNASGDPYLEVAGNGTGNIHRQWTAAPGVDPSQVHHISWKWRFDGDISEFASPNDRIHFMGDDNAQNGSNADNSWLIGVTADRNGHEALDGEWYFFDGTGSNAFNPSNMFDTDLALVADTIYEFNLVVDPTTATYSASISDGVTTVSADNLGFRNGTPGTYDFINFGVNASDTNDILDFSLDSIRIFTIPEPTTATLALLGLAGIARRRRRIA